MREDAQELSDGQVKGGHWIGISLLALSVFCDALVPNFQHQLMHGIGSAPSISNRRNIKEDELEMESLSDKAAAVERDSPTKQIHVVHTGLSSQSLMVNTNSIGFFLLLLSTMIRFSFLPILSFALANPQFILLNLTVGIGLGTAVFSYTELIRWSGPAFAVAVATRE